MILNEIMKAITWDNGDTSPENIRRAIDANREHVFRKTFSRECLNFKRWKDYLRTKGWVDMEYFMFMNGPNPDIMTIQQIAFNNVIIEIFSDDEKRLESLVDDIGLVPVTQPTRTEELIANKEYVSDITEGHWVYDYIGALLFKAGTTFSSRLPLSIASDVPTWYQGSIEEGEIILIEFSVDSVCTPFIHVYAIYKTEIPVIALKQSISKAFVGLTAIDATHAEIIPASLSSIKIELLQEAKQLINVIAPTPPKEPKTFAPTPLQKRASILERSKRISDFIKKIGY